MTTDNQTSHLTVLSDHVDSLDVSHKEFHFSSVIDASNCYTVQNHASELSGVHLVLLNTLDTRLAKLVMALVFTPTRRSVTSRAKGLNKRGGPCYLTSGWLNKRGGPCYLTSGWLNKRGGPCYLISGWLNKRGGPCYLTSGWLNKRGGPCYLISGWLNI